MADAGETTRTVRPSLARSLHLQVIAGRKRPVARAGNDADPEVVALGELVPHRGQLIVRVGVQRVVHLGTVERNDTQRSFVLDGAVLVRHQLTTDWALRASILPASRFSHSPNTSAPCCPNSGAG